MRSIALLGSFVTVGLMAVPGRAHAYTIETANAEGCHESITSEALRTVRLEMSTAAPMATNADEQALIDDVQFTPADDMRDLGAMTLLLGVRDNDLKGRSANDLTELPEVHGSPTGQDEHCLRAETQDEPGGSKAAIIACRTFLRAKIIEALDGLDASGKPDLDNRTVLPVYLAVRGSMDAPLPTYYVKIGQALHTLQDAFTHTYRTADSMEVTVALNWIDYVNKTLDETKDGPVHKGDLDACNDPDALRTKRRELATRASTEILRATLDPKKSKAQKMAAVDVTLDTYLGFQSGCTMANQWCAAPENDYGTATLGCGCTTTAANERTGLAGLFGILGAAFFARRRRSSLVLPSIMALSLVSSVAQAQSDPNNEHATAAPTVTPVAEAGPRDPSETAWGAYGGFSAAFDKPGLAGTAGARLRLNDTWTLGLNVEWNPWFSLNGSAMHSGAINVYGVGILRFPLAYENFNLRSSASLGTSYLLTDLYGAPSGSVGLYFGISPLGLEWKASDIFYVIINPANLDVPVPHLTGVPFFYPQYRFTIGLEFYAG